VERLVREVEELLDKGEGVEEIVTKALELAGKVSDEVRSALVLYRKRFVVPDELRTVVESLVRREFGLRCYYYVDEEPVVESRQLRGPEGTRLAVERAWDTVRCELGGREVDVAYVRMRRGVVEFGTGGQFWLVLNLEVYPSDDLVKELGGEG
jgi:hypothetical protein